jgi:hypothetical protein
MHWLTISPCAAFGVMMWEAATGSAAFKGLHYGGFYQAVVVEGARQPLPPALDPDYVRLITAVRLAAGGGVTQCCWLGLLCHLAAVGCYAGPVSCASLVPALFCRAYCAVCCAAA